MYKNYIMTCPNYSRCHGWELAKSPEDQDRLAAGVLAEIKQLEDLAEYVGDEAKCRLVDNYYWGDSIYITPTGLMREENILPDKLIPRLFYRGPHRREVPLRTDEEIDSVIRSERINLADTDYIHRRLGRLAISV